MRIKLKEFGLNLSGRPLGISTFNIIINKYVQPFELDFDGVFSIGSSFADEVVGKLAQKNGGNIVVYNSSRVINRCLEEVAKDHKIDIVFK